jgi:hypothetical protein
MTGLLKNPGFLGRLTAALFVICLGSAPAAHAAVRGAQAALPSSQAMVGEAVQLQVQVATDKKEDLPWPKVEGLDAFTVSKSVSYSTNSSITVVNGAVSRTEQYITEFVLTLTPQRPGIFTIGPIRYDHKDFHQNLGSATLTVVKSEAGLSSQSSVSKARAYVGEQVLYTLRIVPKGDIQSITLPQDLQKLIGQKFFFQRVEKEINPHMATVDGRETRVFDIRIALFPLLAGPVALEGIPVEYRQVKRNGGGQGRSAMDELEDAFFGGGGRVITQTAMGAPLRLEAQPLPSGAPAGFTGSVGTYSITAKLDKSTAPTGDAVTLTITIRGNGQPKSVTRPVLPPLPAFEVYDPEVASVTVAEGASLWTTTTFKYVLIPARAGAQTIEGLSFSFFDPKRKGYVNAVAPRLSLRVTPGKAVAGGGSYGSQREISELGSDLRYLKTGGGDLHNEADLPYHHVGFFLLLLLPPLAFAGSMWQRRRRERLVSDTAFFRRSQAASKLRKRLKAARAARQAGEGREFYHALSEALIAFASDQFNQEFRGLKLPEALVRLRQGGASATTAEAYELLMQRCDFVLFAGVRPTDAEMGHDLEAGENLLALMDKELG